MNEFSEKRQFPRFQIPIVVDVPELSEIPLVPEELSAGGFQVVVSKKPEIGASVSCFIQIADEVFENCSGQVVWSQESGLDSTAWVAGLEVNMTEGDPDGRLASILEDLSTNMG